jgi:hypothetical protein
LSEALTHIRRRLIEEGDKTLTFFEALDPPDWDQQVYTTGSSWHVRQILAHFISAERAYQAYLRDVLAGGRGAPSDLDIDRFNEAETPPLSRQPVVELIADLRQARSETVRLTEGMDESDLARQAFHPWFGEKDVAFFLKLLYRHHTMHLYEVRRALESRQPNPHTDRFRS